MSRMVIPFGNLKRHYKMYKIEIDEATSRVLASGWYLFGEELEGFERNFAEYCGTRYGIGVASGTDAIQIALVACGVGQGDEVITVSNTCVPTVAGIEAAGALAVLVDIDPATYSMSPTLIEERITEKSKAIVVVHLYGQCVDIDPILKIAEKYGLKVIEDTAQGHGAEYKGKRAGSLGVVGAFSFYPSKNLGAFGDSGMVVTNNTNIAMKARMFRNYGQKEQYTHQMKGINSRMDELQAAILSNKLPHLDRWNERRREIARYYIERLSPLDVVLPLEAGGRKHVFHLFVIRVANRKRFIEGMAGRSVQTAIHYPIPVHLQPAYTEYREQSCYLKITEEQAGKLVSLPIYPELTDSEVEHVATSVVEALKFL